MRRSAIRMLAVGFASMIASGAHAGEACLRMEPGEGGAPLIRAAINDRGPFLFVLDTAASGSTLDPNVVRKLAPPRDTATEQAQGLGGPMDAPLYRIASFEAGPLILRNFTAPEIPAPEFAERDIAGLAGVDLFGDKLAVWRPARRCVDVFPSGREPNGGGWSPIEATWIRPWKILLPVRIDQVEGLALLDTGAQYSVLNPAFADRLGLAEASGRLQPGGEMSGIDGRPLKLSQAEVKSASVGVWTWSGPTIRIADLPVFERLGRADAPLMILGMDWLHDRPFAIDYGARKVWLGGP